MAARGVEASTGGEISEESDERGSMWDLDQQLDQPMDEEAGRLRNMYKEKVQFFFFGFLFRSLLPCIGLFF